MQRQAETIHGMLAEMLNRLDRSNVGKSAGYQNHRKTNGKAEGKSRLGQQLS